MGAGASTELVEKANSASIEDLKAAVAALPAETQAKLREAATPRAAGPETEELTCYCGAVKISVTGEAQARVFCHCDDCRRWGGAVAQAACLYPKDQVKIEGDLLAKPYVEGANCNRKSCAKCGGAVVDDKSATMGMIMVPAGLWKDKQFVPKIHIMYGMKICSMKDGLPKYKTLPAKMGGDDELIEE